MPERRVTAVRLDSAHAYVTHLLNATEDWSPLAAPDAIVEIQLGIHNYYVEHSGKHAQVVDASDDGGRYLRADTDTTPHNNLLDLSGS